MALYTKSPLQIKHEHDIETAIGQAKSNPEADEISISTGDGHRVYAFPPHDHGRVNWGVDSERTGVNLLHAVRLPNGEDSQAE